MNEFLEILKYVLPSLVVFAVAFFVIRAFLDHEVKELKEGQKGEMRMSTLPLRFQAYERVILFLERINPNNLVLRVNRPGLNKEQLQAELLRSVREEYEHNLSQQLYMSDNAWEHVKSAKEEILSDINKAAGQMTEKNTAADYGQQVLSLPLERKSTAHDHAVSFIKDEIRQLFR
jgi:hypothetical protein